MLSNIKRGAVVDTQDGAFGEVYQVIVDPDTKDLTHIVVRPSSGGGDIMAPAEMISSADDAKVVLNVSQSELERRSNELRYDEGEYQAVRPEDVEYQGTAPTQGSPVITAADQDKVSFGDSGAEQPASSTTSYDTDTSTVESHPQGTGQQRKGKELTGLPVMTFAEGEQIGKVKDILFDPEQNRVVALLVDEGGWFSSAKVVPWQNVKTVGVDSVIVPDKSAVVKVDDDPYIKRIMENDNILAGTKVMTEDGRDLGTIGDMLMDDSTGEVVGYEVSGGVFSSTLKGKKFMPAPETISVGKDVAFVPSDVGDQMQAQTGGIVGAAQSAGAAASSGISSAASTVSDQASSAGASASGALAGARDRAVEVTTEQERSYVLGKSTNKDVASDSGEVLVPAGKTVDEGDVQRAENEGKLHALFAATGGAAAAACSIRFGTRSTRSDVKSLRLPPSSATISYRTPSARRWDATFSQTMEPPSPSRAR
ncbi:MAG: PRC-barrel domain-containing protein [Chloroflexia bacterium]